MTILLRMICAILVATILPPVALAQNFDWHKSNGISGYVSAIAFDASGGKWVGMPYGGVAYFDGTAWSNYDSLNTNGGLVDDKVHALLVDQAGHLWVGSESGVSRYDGRQWTRYTHASTGGGLAPGSVTGIAQDRKGNLWFTLARNYDKNGGISRFDGQTWTQWGDTGRSLPSCAGSAVGIAIDTNDVPWAALGNCAASFDGTRWNSFEREQTGGALKGAFSVTADRQGGVWFGGIAVVTRHFNGRWTASGPYGTDIRRTGSTSDRATSPELIASSGSRAMATSTRD